MSRSFWGGVRDGTRSNAGEVWGAARRRLSSRSPARTKVPMSLVLDLALQLPPAGSRDVRRRLHEQLKAAILDGRLTAGLQLPASRALAEQ